MKQLLIYIKKTFRTKQFPFPSIREKKHESNSACHYKPVPFIHRRICSSAGDLDLSEIQRELVGSDSFRRMDLSNEVFSSFNGQ